MPKENENHDDDNLNVDPYEAHLKAAEDLDFSDDNTDNTDNKTAEELAADKVAEEEAAKKDADDKEAKKSPLDKVLKRDKEDDKSDDSDDSDDTGEDKVDDIDDLKAPDDEKFKPDWEKLKTVAKDSVRRVTELEIELKRLKEGEVDPEAHVKATDRLKHLEEENKTFSERLRKVNVQAHPEFRAKYVDPINAKTEEIKGLLAQEGVKTDVSDLLNLEGKPFAEKVSEVTAELTDFNKTQFYNSVREITALKAESAQVIAESDKFLQDQTTQRNVASREVFDNVAKDYDAFSQLEPTETATDEDKAKVALYNSELAKVGQVAEKIALGDISDEDAARVAHEAANYRFLMSTGIERIGALFEAEAVTLRAENEALTKKLAAITKRNPDLSHEEGGDDTSDDPSSMSHEEAAKRIKF